MKIVTIKNNQKVISAVFKGKDSLGYIHGKRYDLILTHTGVHPIEAIIYRFLYGKNVVEQYPVHIMRLDKTGLCPYSNYASFYANWGSVKDVAGN